jgi:hypothetical protein
MPSFAYSDKKIKYHKKKTTGGILHDETARHSAAAIKTSPK